MASVHNENYSKQNGVFPTTFGLRTLVIRSTLRTKIDTSTVARVCACPADALTAVFVRDCTKRTHATVEGGALSHKTLGLRSALYPVPKPDLPCR